MKNTALAQYLVKKDGSGEITQVGAYCKLLEQGLSIDYDMQQFFDVAWNIDTAQGAWLDNWGVWVGIGRELYVPGATGDFFGFDEGVDFFPFNEQPFYDANQDSDTVTLSDDVYRRLILVKAFASISDCSVITINKILRLIFGEYGKCYTVDNLDMSVNLQFEFNLQPWQESIIKYSNALPRPAGVKYNITQYTADMFGFDADYETFDNGIMN